MQRPQAKVKKAERQSAVLVGKSLAGNRRKFSLGKSSVESEGQVDDVEMIDLTIDD